MRVLVCGDREYNDKEMIYYILDQYLQPSTEDRITYLIHGAARGADSLAGDWAEHRGIKCASLPADWDNQGRAAGPIRNRWMLYMQPDMVIAFHTNIEKSKGTKDCITEAKRRGIKTEVISDTFL